jgi:hypothetical protein
LTGAGGAKCWGEYRGLGNEHTIPEDVPGVESTYTAIAVGLNDTCALTPAGAIDCWGETYGPEPVGVGLASDVASIAGGGTHVCAVTTSGAVRCRSDATGAANLDSGAQALSGVSSVSVAWEHACAIISSGGVRCWGDNTYGELGDGTTIDRLTPVDVAGVSGAVALATGDNHSCAALATGRVMCWGLRYGRSAVEVAGLADVIDIDSAFGHTCALTSGGGVKCWGSNAYGQLGDGMRCGANCHTTVDVAGLQSGVATISVGVFHTCAVLDGGGAKCWGNNYIAQLGLGIPRSARSISTVPADVVVQDIKPTPTPVPCPPEGCLEPTPQPPLPQTGVDFSMTVDVDGDGIPDCGTGPDDRAECLADPGATFTATVSLNALPVGTADYTGVDIGLELASLRPTTYVDWEWPDCGFPAQHFDQRLRRYLIGCASGGALTSSYGGVLLNVEFVCDRNGSLTLRHDELYTQLSNFFGSFSDASYHEPIAGEGVAITCGDLIAGDADCNVGVDAVDAAVTLQKEAALLAFLGCPQQSDVNLDNQTNSVDATVTLQYTAGLVDTLPPQLAGR